MSHKLVTFSPRIKTLGILFKDKVFDFKEIRDEPMFFGASPLFVAENGGPITKDIMGVVIGHFLSNLQYTTAKDYKLVIDTRVNMLMPGQYPSIPGWHCDDLTRGENGQPDLNQVDDKIRHFMVLVSDTKDLNNCISGTEFVTNMNSFSINPEKVWQSLHQEVEANKYKTAIRKIKERELIEFNQMAIHRATPATTRGWRLFFRLSYTYRQPINEIRNQVQIYVDPNNAGW